MVEKEKPENVQEAAEQDLELRSSQASNLIKKHVIVVMGASLVPVLREIS